MLLTVPFNLRTGRDTRLFCKETPSQLRCEVVIKIYRVNYNHPFVPKTSAIQSSIYVSFPLRIRSLIIQLLNVNTKEKQQRCILAIPMTPFNHLILRCCFIT